jgi:hypothetical protein
MLLGARTGKGQVQNLTRCAGTKKTWAWKWPTEMNQMNQINKGTDSRQFLSLLGLGGHCARRYGRSKARAGYPRKSSTGSTRKP